MQPEAVPFLVVIGSSMAVLALCKAAELLGPIGIRRVAIVASAVFLASVMTALGLMLWQQAWWQGALLFAFLSGGLIRDWKTTRFARWREDW